MASTIWLMHFGVAISQEKMKDKARKLFVNLWFIEPGSVLAGVKV